MPRPPELIKAARGGDPQAQFDLGCAYDSDPPKKKRVAISWYLKAAEQGHAEAQNFLGELYRDGWTVKRNLRKAYKWFRLAAAHGNDGAQLSLGEMLFYGRATK